MNYNANVNKAENCGESSRRKAVSDIADKKIYVWGTGALSARLIENGLPLESITAFIDNSSARKDDHLGKKVYPPEHLLSSGYDAVIVANIYSADIYEQSIGLGLDMDKMIFITNNFAVTDINRNYQLIEDILGEETAANLKTADSRFLIIPRARSFPDSEVFSVQSEKSTPDYVRVKSLEMAAAEIRKYNIQGEAAEFGVFNGGYAKYINTAFPDKKLYLFDTFEGFDTNEAKVEMDNGNCGKTFVTMFNNANIDLVLSRMKYPDNVIIVKGFFPDSLNGLEDTFAFVSLDVDFELPILNGLRYFYPRLSKGGYIFVHEYNDPSLSGVEKAVRQYESEIGSVMCKFPLCDNGGSLAITK